VDISDREECTAFFFGADVRQHGKVADYAEVEGRRNGSHNFMKLPHSDKNMWK
jgi:hypothetical protein